MEKGWKGLKMAGHLMVSTIAHSESGFLGQNALIEPQYEVNYAGHVIPPPNKVIKYHKNLESF